MEKGEDLVKVAIIGSSTENFVAAILLIRQGFEVSIYEKKKASTGKLETFQVNGYNFEFGPVMVTSPKIIQQFFYAIEREMDTYFELFQIRHHTKNISQKEEAFYLSSDYQFMHKQLERIDPIGAKNYDDFLAEIKKMKYAMNDLLKIPPLSTWRQLLSPPARSAYLALKPFETLDKFVRKYFTNEFVIASFSRYATYNGISPDQCPAFLITQAYDELVDGVYYAKGGNVKIRHALHQIALEEGVRYYTEKEVTKIHIKENHVHGVCLNDDISLEADVVVMNIADFKQQKNLIREVQSEAPESLVNTGTAAAYVLFVGLKSHTEIYHHQILYSQNIKQEFEMIQQGKVPIDPTVYIYNPSYSEQQRFSKGDALLLFTNMPYTTNEKKLSKMKRAIYDKLEKAGLSIEKDVVVEQRWTPENLTHRFDLYRQGGAMRKMTQLILNPLLKEYPFDGLYFTGMQPYPASSIASSLRNGEIVAERIIQAYK